MIVKQRTRDGWELDVPGVVPKLSATPGTLRKPAPHLGEDTDGVLAELGLSTEQIAALRDKGVAA
jgi:formyl-CoA transferase